MTFCDVGIHSVEFGDVTVVHDWVAVKYEWPSEASRLSLIQSGKYVPENNIIAGIKLYNDRIFVTTPRWKLGVPSTLNEVTVLDGEPYLRPFPTWDAQDLGDCSAFQYVMSMEIDPNTGKMYIIDNGRINIFSSDGTEPILQCPPKLMIYDLERESFDTIYTFPEHVVEPNTTFLNDLAIDDKGFVYITNAGGDGSLVVYDGNTNTSRKFTDSRMGTDPYAKAFIIGRDIYEYDVPIDGIAMSPDFKYLYFCALTAFDLYQIPTEDLRNPKKSIRESIRPVGRKVTQSGGITMGQRNLYYGAVTRHSVYMWERQRDLDTQRRNEGDVLMTSQKELAQNDNLLYFQDTFAWGDDGYLWLVTNKLPEFMSGTMNFTGDDINIRIIKIYVDEGSYLLNDAYSSSRSIYAGIIIALLCFVHAVN